MVQFDLIEGRIYWVSAEYQAIEQMVLESILAVGKDQHLLIFVSTVKVEGIPLRTVLMEHWRDPRTGMCMFLEGDVKPIHATA